MKSQRSPANQRWGTGLEEVQRQYPKSYWLARSAVVPQPYVAVGWLGE